ncbi:aldose epimerase family protein [Kitasatospora sp. NPDC088391]|uniref:aldose epimerase family protein n=1 Tax=Kitasatospora sp. NPDC088391 TaxID=3364074 RepID=UPI00381A7810
MTASDRPTEVLRAPFDHSGAGVGLERWTLRSGPVEATVITLGAALHTLTAPDRDGVPAQVLLTTDDVGLLLGPARHYGVTVGRFANRIADSRITLDGEEFALLPTGHGVTLHGGPDSFSHRVWAAEEIPGGVRMHLHSPDGDQGFPGALDVWADFTLTGSDLVISYRAVTTRPTVVNLTNHAYFNLAGEGSGDVLGHLLTLDADHYTPVNEQQVPYGPYEPVAGTPFDFTAARAIGEGIAAGGAEGHPQLKLSRGYDHNWVLRERPADGPPVRAALLADPGSGRTLEVLTTEPGLQVYTANGFDGSVTGPSGAAHGPFAGVALETQHHPDSPHHPQYPSTELRPGQEFRSTTVLRLGTAG